VAATVAGTALPLSAAVAGAAPGAPAAVPPATLGGTIDYFDGVYDALGPNSVFETVTVERFEYLLKSKPGNFAFLIGDPKDPSTQATIGHIDAVAKGLGVTKIYNFTPKLDGDKLNLWDLSQSGLRTGVSPDPAGGNRAGQGLAQYEALGNRLITDYLNKDTQTQFTKSASSDPYLFVYNKDRTVGADQDRIVAALSGAKTVADLDTAPEQSAYRSQVASVLGSAALDTNTQFDFLRDEHNRRHYERYVKNADATTEADQLARYGGAIFDESDSAAGFRVENITYPELRYLVQQPGDYALLFGGTWCHNTAAIIKDANRLAQEHGIKKVYNFDFSLSSTGNAGSDAFHIRDNALASAAGGQVIRPSNLYGDLVNDYLTNAITQYRKTGDAGTSGANFVSYYPGGDTTKPLAEARKIQVGHVLSYNKDHVDADGNRAPVIDQAIRQNDDGGNTEHMTEWWFVKGRNLAAGDATLRGALNPTSQTGSNQLQSQRAFAKEAIDEIDAVFRGFSATDVASTVNVTGLTDGADVLVGTTPTVDVTVTAPGFAPFISLYTANQNAEPPATPETGEPRGTVQLLDGATKVAEARLTRQGTASFTLPALTLGSHPFTVKYLGRGDLIDPSQAVRTINVVNEATVSGAPAIASVTPGQGRATVTWTAPSDTGGSAITGYKVTPYLGDTAQTPIDVTGAATLSTTVDGLANGTALTFTVAAVNGVGTSAASARSAAVTPQWYLPWASGTAAVDQLFTWVTGKAPTPAQRTAWLAKLDAGDDLPGDLVAELRRGADATANVDPTSRLYAAYLTRIPDKGGLDFWVNRRRSGWTLFKISSSFASSNEFKTRYGSLSNKAFVQLVYTNVLGRPADQGGLDYWTKRLDTKKVGRGQVLINFSESNEYKTKTAKQVDAATVYISVIGRAPTTAERDAFVTALGAGTPLGDLVQDLIDQAAFAARVG
jgi:hypothetical protein